MKYVSKQYPKISPRMWTTRDITRRVIS